jgi:hypothetical protein
MKRIVMLAALGFAAVSNAHQISEQVVMKMVKEDIYQYEGRMLGVRYVDSLVVEKCSNASCELSFSYETSGCHWEMCYDLTCKGTLEFDLSVLETEVKAQECLEN